MADEQGNEFVVENEEGIGEESQNESQEGQDEFDLSDFDMEAIADMSDEDLEKALQEPENDDSSSDAGKAGESSETEGTIKTDSEEGSQAPVVEPELEKLKKQLQDKETFIQDRNTKIGELRHQLELALAVPGNQPPPQPGDNEVDEVMKERFFTDPIGTMQKLIAERERRETLKTSVLQTGIREVVPDIDEIKEDIATLALEDGWESSAVDAFRKNVTGDIPLIKAYAARVKQNKTIETLTAERDELRKQVEAMPKAILQKIDAAAKKKNNMTGKSGGVVGKETTTLDESQLAEVSDEDLERMLAQMGSKEK